MNIKTFTLTDVDRLPECLDILERTQGRMVTTLESLKRSLLSEEEVLVVAELDSKIIAVAQAKIFSSETKLDFYMPFGADIITKMKKSKVGSFSSMGVHESFQGKGIGQKLSSFRQKWLLDRGVNLVVGISWVSGLSHTSDRVFEKMGFTAVCTVDGLFLSFTDLICPVCKRPPCRCSGRLYIKEFTGQ